VALLAAHQASHAVPVHMAAPDAALLAARAAAQALAALSAALPARVVLLAWWAINVALSARIVNYAPIFPQSAASQHKAV